MKKFLIVFLLAAVALTSKGQTPVTYDICYDPTCVYTYPLLSPPPGYVYNPCLPSPPPVPSNAPIVCYEVTIDNQTQCDMDFWWEYDLNSIGNPNCSGNGILPAYWWEPWEGYNQTYAPCAPLAKPQWPPTSTYDNHTIPYPGMCTIKGYQMKWSCNDYATCICPEYLRLRVGNPSINFTDPLSSDLIPFGLTAGSTYTLAATCNGNPITMTVVSVTPPITNPPPCGYIPGQVKLEFN